jgi:hypothetical protein
MSRFSRIRRGALCALLASVASLAGSNGLWAHDSAVARLRGFEEVPAISSPGGGRFEATIGDEDIAYELSYFNLRGVVSQAHIHLAQRGVNGAIVIFLCSNLPNAPAGTQPCPASPGTISGTIHASDVIGGTSQTAQGISAGEFSEVLRAIRVGVTYVNVHTDLFPGGEIRGQLLFTPEDDGH